MHNKVKDIMTNGFFCLDKSESIYMAARTMKERNFSAIGVSENGELVGVFSERDIVRRIVAAKNDPESSLLETFMSSPVIAVKENDALDEALYLMKEKDIRHIVVLNNNEKPVGVISIRDVFQHMLGEKIDDMIASLKADLEG